MILGLAEDSATAALGAALAARLRPQFGYIALRGGLGAGKTTLVRGLLRACGEAGPVRSPTFTLLESYTVRGLEIMHLDLYRLGQAEELEFLGLRDWLATACTLLIEWPERGEGLLPPPDLTLDLEPAGVGRRAAIQAHSPYGVHLVAGIRGVDFPVIQELNLTNRSS